MQSVINDEGYYGVTGVGPASGLPVFMERDSAKSYLAMMSSARV
jgi:hypothetical protein